ncbi:ankyrin [Basidiobolus meristosporus CBS 931.73]|uniref:Ankyrin n=1 Tax=Basidiobolus meristosporus CBS 931.73 TaxID=1314790 RepID=A0A1Y1XQ22_9FUNG|nr:ankyrin [Basidiobolus meristosporus CBS 931.73]|eukprot:ORX87831.1 ankyrin [Basidiobolus meristosporus CBS 931.73]
MSVVKKLLEKGTKPTCFDERLRTPLHFACASGCIELINLLVERGAKVNSRDVNGSTPLLLAVTSGKLECVSTLLAAGANLEIADTRQRTPLSMAKSRLQFLKRQVEFDLPLDYEEMESTKAHLIHQISQIIRILHYYVAELKRKPTDDESMVVVEEESLNELENRLVNLSVGEAGENNERKIMDELSALMGKFDLA